MVTSRNQGSENRIPPGVLRAAVLAVLAASVVVASGQGGKPGTDRARTPSSGKAVVRERVVEPKVGTLVVLTGVAGAEIRLIPAVRGRGRSAVVRADSSGGAIFEKLTPGRYRVTASAVDFRDASAEVTIVAGKSHRIDAGPLPIYGTVALSGTDLVEATSVSLDGRALDERSLVRDTEGRVRFRAEPGEHEIAIEAPGRLRETLRVRVEAGSVAPVAVALRRVPATLRIRSVAGAAVWVDESQAGRVSSAGELAVEVDPIGAHTVRVEADGYLPFKVETQAKPGESVQVACDLKRRPTSGPFGDLFIDDALGLWAKPESGWSVDPGVRVLEITGDGVGLAKDLYYEDVEIRFGLKVRTASGAAWVVRASPKGDGYVFVLTGPGGRWPNQLRVCALEGGRYDPATPIYTPQPVNPDVILGESYVVRVRVEGDSVRTWLHSGATGETVSIGSFVDRERRFTAGTIGFAGTGGRFEVFGLEASPILRSEPDAKADLNDPRR